MMMQSVHQVINACVVGYWASRTVYLGWRRRCEEEGRLDGQRQAPARNSHPKESP
jgi:hypothetical protein